MRKRVNIPFTANISAGSYTTLKIDTSPYLSDGYNPIYPVGWNISGSVFVTIPMLQLNEKIIEVTLGNANVDYNIALQGNIILLTGKNYAE